MKYVSPRKTPPMVQKRARVSIRHFGVVRRYWPFVLSSAVIAAAAIVTLYVPGRMQRWILVSGILALLVLIVGVGNLKHGCIKPLAKRV